ncbi:metal-dependent hydrolase [Aurantiacibacter aquimixticola]|uniref:Metal-dependent hydrolase n=1 Tax=Aurantiacibacter aquimixticola TaxID=1958945 RepID=A0A419RSI7_9SPHN|nr:metal-dependent hydrolase [Aurantiacibacter aquimixticola]RJY08747.1 metal-dependent hydrolase [Aurantiacibacter aquimixticola]
MDNLTHSLVGALIGQTGLKKKTGLAMPALIIGANLPDVDAACFFWLEGVEHLGLRRGITHGPPALVLLPLILAGLLWGFDRWQASRGKRPKERLPVHIGWLYGLAFLGCLTHPALDWLNVYGIRLLEPFSSEWFYGDTLFIIDVWLWGLMGFAVWWSLRQEKRGRDWRRTGRQALALVLIYIGVQSGVTNDKERTVSDAPIRPDIVIASPPPLWSLNRDMVFWSSEEGAALGMERIGNMPLSACDLDAARLADSEVEAFLFWSRTPVLDLLDDGSFVLGDARFYEPLSRERFSVEVPAQFCSEPGAR